MNTIEQWQQAMQPQEGDVSCMDDIEVYSQWVSEIDDNKCPFCSQQVVSRKAVVCANSFINLNGLADMCKGGKVADVIVTFGVIDIVLGGVDH